MNKRNQFYLIVASFLVLTAWLMTPSTSPFTIINQDDPVAGNVTKGDVLTLFGLFGGIIGVVMYFASLGFLWKRRKRE